jgi:hypothetical protein
MNIEYCHACGLRIRDADLESGAAVRGQDGLAFCAQCRPARGKSSAHQAASLKEMVKSSGATLPKSGRSQARVSGGIPPKVMIGSAIAVVVLLILVVVLLNSGTQQPPQRARESRPPANQPSLSGAPAIPPPLRADANKTTEPAKTKETDPPVVKTKTDAAEDPRESYARRLWGELKAKAEQDPAALWGTHTAIRDFVSGYGSTAAGKEAAAFMKNKVVDLPPVPTPDRTLANLRADFTPEKPKTGWSYLWNADGEIGRAANYKPLVWNAKANMYTGNADVYPAMGTPQHYVRMALDGGHPGMGTEQNESGGIERYAIAAYTIQPGQACKVAITGRVTCNARDGRVELRLYLNDEAKGSSVVGGGTSLDFSTWLGEVKDGDTIYVAVGPNRNDGNDTYGLTITVHR